MSAVAAALLAVGPVPGGVAVATAPVFQQVGEYSLPGRLAAGFGAVALTQIGESSATLLVGNAGALPTPAPGAGQLPEWAQPHVGTTAKGHRVVVYPRCTGGVATCDLYAYDVNAQTEARIPKVNATSKGEIEGAMDRGALAFVRWSRTSEPDVSGPVAAHRMAHITTTLALPVAHGVHAHADAIGRS